MSITVKFTVFRDFLSTKMLLFSRPCQPLVAPAEFVAWRQTQVHQFSNHDFRKVSLHVMRVICRKLSFSEYTNYWKACLFFPITAQQEVLCDYTISLLTTMNCFSA